MAKIAAAKGRPLMPWQRAAADVALEYYPSTGLYRYGIVVLTVPRQAGKTDLESHTADHRCLTRRDARVWITMQNGKTVDSWMREEHFQSLRRARIFGTPGRRGAKYSESRRAGEVGVSWMPSLGSTFYTFPPKHDALHSKQGDLIFVDEAWVHGADAGADLRQAIRPTMATRRGSQLWVVSTQGDDASVYFDDYLDMGEASLSDPESRVCFIDYGIPDGADPEDLETIAAHHPAYGHTIDLQALRDARTDFKTDSAGWARAYGNRRTRSRTSAFPPGAWSAAGHARLPIPQRVGLAVDTTPDGARTAIAAAWRDDQGTAFAELLYAGATTRDLPGVLVNLMRRYRAPLTVDRASVGALELTDAVALAWPRADVRFLNATEYGSACTVFRRGIIDRSVRHFNDDDLDAAADVAVMRALGDGAEGWGRKGSTGSIAELVAATCALRGFDTLPMRDYSGGVVAVGH